MWDVFRGSKTLIFPCCSWSGGFELLYILHKNRDCQRSSTREFLEEAGPDSCKTAICVGQSVLKVAAEVDRAKEIELL